MESNICLLPGGYVDKSGTIQREAELLSLSGREEELLAANIHRGESASLVTAVLCRCVRRIGTISPVSEEVSRNLLIADRQYLMLRLRELTFGEQVQATLLCPWPGCGSKMDIDFSLRDIPVRESQDKGPFYRMELSEAAAYTANEGEKFSEIVFRLPVGGDQETLSPLVYKNEAQAFTMLLKHCIQKIGPYEHPEEELIYKLSPRARMEIEREMARVAPQIELAMEAVCPECQRPFEAPFDLQRFFFGELETTMGLLYREIHYLAYHYHWSEKEILEMPREKRHRYIEILAEEIERMNNEA